MVYASLKDEKWIADLPAFLKRFDASGMKRDFGARLSALEQAAELV